MHTILGNTHCDCTCLIWLQLSRKMFDSCSLDCDPVRYLFNNAWSVGIVSIKRGSLFLSLYLSFYFCLGSNVHVCQCESATLLQMLYVLKVAAERSWLSGHPVTGNNLGDESWQVSLHLPSDLPINRTNTYRLVRRRKAIWAGRLPGWDMDGDLWHLCCTWISLSKDVWAPCLARA